MTEAEQIAVILDEIREQIATCPTCRTLRQLRRRSGAILHAQQARCRTAGDAGNTCQACAAAEDRYYAVCVEEIRAIAGHPHETAVHVDRRIERMTPSTPNGAS